MTIRVLLADDNEITRRGLTWIMDSSPDVEVCGEAVDGEEAVARAGELQPDVVLLDVRMPRLDGLESIGHLLNLPHPPRILMLTTFHEASRYGSRYAPPCSPSNSTANSISTAARARAEPGLVPGRHPVVRQ
ncbi:response regulator transcription factor [Streptomyces sp900116325]|uniref:response regulator n=1 Tax=Streptomyces sp. 900116325 TaxID=3154295 RepID=UPI0033BC5BC3